MKAPFPILLYDGTCGFCNGAVQFILKKEKDKKLHFAPLQSELGKEQLRKHGYPINYTDSVAYLDGNGLFVKKDALLHIAKHLKISVPLRTILFLSPTFIVNFCYDLIAKKRHALVNPVCLLPTSTQRARFILK